MKARIAEGGNVGAAEVPQHLGDRLGVGGAAPSDPAAVIDAAKRETGDAGRLGDQGFIRISERAVPVHDRLRVLLHEFGLTEVSRIAGMEIRNNS